MMKLDVKKIGMVVALAGATALLPSPASADPTPSPSPDISRSPMEQFKFDRDNFAATMKMRAQMIRNINQDFKIACDKAAQDFKVAMSSAKTPDQKNLASNARKSAINLAILARDAAIAALGPEPTPPVEPAKPMRISGKSKSRN